MIRRVLSAALAALVLSMPARADGPTLSAALSAAASRDWAAALATADRAGPVARDVIDWQRLRAGEGTWDDYRGFLARRADWPGLPLLSEKGEAAIPPGADPQAVIAYFGAPPQTGTGALRLAEAQAALGQPQAAQATVVAAWRSLLLNDAERTALLDRHGAALAPHHEARLDMLLWRGAAINARAMLPLVSDGWRRLAEARIALREDLPGVDGLIAAVPPALANDPGLAFERFQWRAQRGRNADAIALALERSGNAETLGDPARWASWRAVLARWAMREGRAQDAYRLAAGHHLSDGASYADLEWLAGFVALRQLNDPATALRHFQRFRTAVATPISLSRAGYWEGRAREAMGDPVGAQAAYEFGAEHQTAFYGLLAAEKAGVPMDPALASGGPTFPDWRGGAFASSSVLEAALMLRQAGDRGLFTRFLLHLAESQDATGLGQLSDLALSLDEPYTALSVAKQAAERGVILPRAYFPVTDLARADLGVPPEWTLAIARRESEFNPVVVSPAGALGLMQVMPGTAQDMARALGVDYSRGRLTSDPAYNARLGAAYLRKLFDEFGDSPVLVAVGYNAGPGRSRSWTAERGHPAAADVVDWIEMIPFTETRNYVMRVSETLPIYRARLTGEAQPIRFLQELSAR